MMKEKLVYSINKSKTRKRVEKISGVLVKTIFITITMLLLYTPILIIALLSFNNSKSPLIFNGLTLRWYQELFVPVDNIGEVFQNAVFNTLLVTILSTIISTILGTLFAIGMNSLRTKNRQRMIMFNNIPIVNADIVTGITLMILFSIFVPLLNIWTVLIAHIFFCIPYVVLSVLPKLSMLDDNLYDAAVDLGCSSFKAIIKVIVPAIKPGIMMGLLLAFTMSIDDFTISYFTGASLQSNYNVSTFIYLNSGKKTQSPSMYAYNTLITFGTLFVLIIYNVISSVKNKKNLKKKNGGTIN